MNLFPRAAHCVLTALKRNGKSVLLEELAEIGADEEVLERLLTRLKRAAAQDLELGYPYAFLLSWLVARVGPRLSTSYEMLEAEVGNAAKAGAALVMPRWTLAMPIDGALQRRMPCKPLVEDEDEELTRAYLGLVDHLAFVSALPEASRRLEMLNTAIPWRVVALADRLEPEAPRTDGRSDPIATRLQRLKGRTVGGGRTPMLERDWWRSLDGDLCLRRHALSHLGETEGGWTFTKCVDSMWTLDEARAATAAIALAVLDRVARYLRDVPATTRMLDDVMGDTATAWLDEYVDG
jgi:hypothetical protein